MIQIHALTDDNVEGVDRMLDAFDWWFVPLANPDGYVYTWTHDRMWRKNRKPPPSSSSSCHGVDLNRNFDAAFSDSSNKSCSNSYGGPAPFSEPETLAIKELLQANGDRLKATVFVHSFSQLWLAPYGVNTSRPAEYDEMERVMQRAVRALNDTHQTAYEYGSISDVLYSASGTAVDYCYESLGVVYSFLVELRDKGHTGFVLPIDQIVPTASETWNGIREMAAAIQEKLQ